MRNAGRPTCRTAARRAAVAFPDRILKRLKQGTAAFLEFIVNPVAGLPSAFQKLDRQSALEVGVLYGIVFDICVVIGVYAALPKFLGGPGIGDILKLFVVGLVPFVGVAGACAVARSIFRGTGNMQSDVFIAGSALLPSGFLVLLSGLLGVGNWEVVAVLTVFTGCYTILLLYSGCTRISQVHEGKAAAAVPVIIILGGWIAKIVFTSIV